MLLHFHRLGWWKYVLVSITLLTAAFLLLPILFITALSFGSSQWLIFPPPAWTTKWYSALFADPRQIKAARDEHATFRANNAFRNPIGDDVELKLPPRPDVSN